MVNVSANPIIVGDIWSKYGDDDFVIVSPDIGGAARARSIAKKLDKRGEAMDDHSELAIIDKRRPAPNVSEVMHIIGDVAGRTCIMIDDMADTTGTLCKGAIALKEHGAEKVVAYCTHAVLSGSAYDNIHASVLHELVITDTIPLHTSEAWANDQKEEKIRVISVAGLLAETINRLHNHGSISALYL